MKIAILALLFAFSVVFAGCTSPDSVASDNTTAVRAAGATPKPTNDVLYVGGPVETYVTFYVSEEGFSPKAASIITGSKINLVIKRATESRVERFDVQCPAIRLQSKADAQGGAFMAFVMPAQSITCTASASGTSSEMTMTPN